MSPKELFTLNPQFAYIRKDVSGWVDNFVKGMARDGNQPEYILDNLVKLKLGADPYEIFGEKIAELVTVCETKFESSVIESWVLARMDSARYSLNIRNEEEYAKWFLERGCESSFPKVFKPWFDQYASTELEGLVSFY